MTRKYNPRTLRTGVIRKVKSPTFVNTSSQNNTFTLHLIKRCAKNDQSVYPRIAQSFGLTRELTDYERRKIRKLCRETLIKGEEIFEGLMNKIRFELFAKTLSHNENPPHKNVLYKICSILVSYIFHIFELFKCNTSRKEESEILISEDELIEENFYPCTREPNSTVDLRISQDKIISNTCFHCGSHNHEPTSCSACFSDEGNFRKPKPISTLGLFKDCTRCLKVFNKQLQHPLWLCPWRPEALHLYDSGFIKPIGIYSNRWYSMQRKDKK